MYFLEYFLFYMKTRVFFFLNTFIYNIIHIFYYNKTNDTTFSQQFY